MTGPSTTTSYRRSWSRPAREPAAASPSSRSWRQERPRRGAVGGDGIQAVGRRPCAQEHQLRGRPPLDPVGHKAVERQGLGLGPIEADRSRVCRQRAPCRRPPPACCRATRNSRSGRIGPVNGRALEPSAAGDHELPPVAVRSPAGEHELRAIGREVGRLVFRRSGDDRRGSSGHRVEGDDVAGRRPVDDRAIGRRTEGQRSRRGSSDRQEGEADRGDESKDDQEPGDPGDGHKACGELHREPPFEARPCRALTDFRRSRQDLVEVARRAAPSLHVEPAGDRPVEAFVTVHARRPSATSARGRESASSAARMDWRARWRRDFAVPSGILSTTATSGSGRSR